MVKKNSLEYFYQTISDLKNNFDNLINTLRDNNDGNYAKDCSPTPYQSKYPDLKKLGILEENWKLTPTAKDLINYKEKDELAYQKLVCDILDSYDYRGIRPYVIIVKFLYSEFLESGTSIINRKNIVQFFSLPINQAILYSEKKFDISNIETVPSANLPYTYVVNFLKNAGILIKENLDYKINEEETKAFVNLFLENLQIEEIASTTENILEDDILRHNTLAILRGNKQNLFRKELLKIYNNKCALSSQYCYHNESNLLEAAHIVPVSKGGGYHISNGILMTPNIHNALDSGVISFEDDYKIITSKSYSWSKEFLGFNGQKINLPADESFYPSKECIKYHRENIFVK